MMLTPCGFYNVSNICTNFSHPEQPFISNKPNSACISQTIVLLIYCEIWNYIFYAMFKSFAIFWGNSASNLTRFVFGVKMQNKMQNKRDWAPKLEMENAEGLCPSL